MVPSFLEPILASASVIGSVLYVRMSMKAKVSSPSVNSHSSYFSFIDLVPGFQPSVGSKLYEG